jgi:hypothetical protein
MNRTIAEWLWRAAVLCLLAWIGWGVYLIHQDTLPPPDNQAIEAGPDPLQRSLDDLREELTGLTEKVDAMLVAMARSN